MSDLPSKAVIARVFLLAGALLAILLFASPQRHVAYAQSLPGEMIDYAERDTAPVAAYTAVDPEDESIVWTRAGADAEDFTIDGGVLQFVRIPNYEDPHDSGENNSYTVTVTASDGTNESTQEVTVSIVNLEEEGTVSLSTRQPQVGNSLTATLTDPDGADNVTPPVLTSQTDLTEPATWQWARSRNGSTGWTDIDDEDKEDAKTATYTPAGDDVGYFLRATASYNDGQGDDKSAEMVSSFAVRPVPYSNEMPVFQDAEGEDLSSTERSVAEDAAPGDPVGDPVQATDAAETGPDVLTYKLDNTDTFSIDIATGQIELGEGTKLDYDTQPISYTVTVTATDPSGLNDTISVTINITNVDETPVVTVSSGTTVKTHNENEPAAQQVATFLAEDPEDNNADLTWRLSGADGDKFDITDTGAERTLTFKTSPDFEAPGDANRNRVYEVTAQATDSGGNTGSLDITVTVGNINEDGRVTLSNLQPEDFVPITAMLEDPDVVVQSSVEWQWSKSTTRDGTYNDIKDATSATYKPDGGDVGSYLRATATYNDGQSTVTKRTANNDPDLTNSVQAADTDNKAPMFLDSAGDPVTSRDRSVAENAAADAVVGDPVVAMDERPDGQGGTTPDDTNLTYSLSGRDAGSFKIDRDSGQIRVRAGDALDFETKPSHTVTVKVEDPSRATDTVTVNIAVTNVEEDPEITAGESAINHEESDGGAVATYTATDPEDDSARPRRPLSWSLEGPDTGLFDISNGGVLTFKQLPDYEAQDTDNEHEVTVRVTDSNNQADTRVVAVTVTNVEEAGTLNLSAEQPQEDVPLTAILTDPDGSVTGEMWQWARSRNRSSGWTDIDDEAKEDAKTASYTPAEDDVGYYLRATVTYKDGESAENEKTAQEVSTHSVRKKPYVNAAPVFQDAEGADLSSTKRSVAENSRAGAPVGDPVAAMDQGEFGPDVLTYTLGGTDANSFDIDWGTGQIRVKAGNNLDYEDPNNRDHEYVVTVTATDPSHIPGDGQNDFSDSITVTIIVTNVDETPMFTVGDTEVNHAETDSSGMVTYTPAVADYTATDPEDDSASPRKPLKWSLSGVDGRKFEISDAGALTFETPPDYEAPVDSGRNNVYNVRVEVTDSGGNTATRVVTVTVTKIEEAGTVTLLNLQPEDGIDLMARLTDPDGRTSGLNWQWAKTVNKGTPPRESDYIEVAMSATYRPVAADVGHYLWAIASYADPDGQDKTARKVSEYAVQAADTKNERPKFRDQDVDTEGDQTDQIREVAENTAAGAPVGDPVTAMDPDDNDNDGDGNDNLTYTLGGDDQNSFVIGRATGQITVGEETKLNFESKDTYTVEVTATDAADDSATITVTIKVTPVDEPPELSKKALVVVGDERVDYLENGPDAVETYSAAGPDSVGARWSLSGTDANRFALSNGVLSFRSSPNFEAPTDADSDNVYNVTVQASKGSLQDARNVTIKVINKEEKGSISLSSQQPNVGVGLVATLTDPDGGVTGERWQWARSPDGSTRWSDIPAASAATYTPVLADAANFLRVTVTYTDAQGPAKDANAITAGATGVDNDGVVTLSSSTPRIGVELTATLSDPDGGVMGESWQWARSADGSTNWADIATAMSNAYTPVAADEGSYLRATVSYTDGDGPGKSADAVSADLVAPNSAPEFESDIMMRAVAENTAAGENIGAAVAATDPDAGDTLTYSLSGGADMGSFTIDGGTGQIRVGAGTDLDFEGAQTTYMVEVMADDGNGESDTVMVTIGVTDVNEAPVFAEESVTLEVAENTAAGENIGAAVAATDPDAGDTLTYTLGGADADSFDIDDTTGQLMTSAALDFETKASYSVEVMADDGNGESATVMVTITVTDVNEAPEFPAAETGARSVAENTAAGENIGAAVAATDPDAGDTLTYSLSGGADMGSFTIDGGTGQIRVGAGTDLDFEGAQTTYMVEVMADDGNGESDTVMVTIGVTDVNEAPVFAEESVTLEVAENTAAGENIGAAVAATDPDAGDTLTYTLGGDDAASFDIDDTTGQLMTSAALDFETKASYSVEVTADDGNGESATVMVTIGVTDVNEAPEFPAAETGARSVAENTAAGENIGAAVAATDPDAGDTLTYTLGGDDAASFDIDAATGQLMTKAALDFETKASYSVEVTADDGNGESATIDVTIGVTDVNEAPEFPAAETGARSVAENTAAGENIGAAVAATDPDAGDTLTYTLGGDDADSFDIDAATGQLMTKAALDFETKASYSVEVTADDGNGGTDTIGVTIGVTITVIDVNEAPVFAEESVTLEVAENTAAGENIGAAVAATDPDAGDTLTYTLGGDDADSFDIDAATGQLMTKAALDFETKASYSVEVTADDGNGESATVMVTIGVTDVTTGNAAGDAYDSNEDGTIDVEEALDAVDAYFDGDLDLEGTLDVIDLYFDSRANS